MIDTKGYTMFGVRPISDLRNRFSEVEKEIRHNDKPIIFTTNGKASMVTISFDKFSKMAHLDYIERSLDDADAYAESHPGTLTHEEVFSKIRKKVNGEPFAYSGIPLDASAEIRVSKDSGRQLPDFLRRYRTHNGSETLIVWAQRSR